MVSQEEGSIQLVPSLFKCSCSSFNIINHLSVIVEICRHTSKIRRVSAESSHCRLSVVKTVWGSLSKILGTTNDMLLLLLWLSLSLSLSLLLLLLLEVPVQRARSKPPSAQPFLLHVRARCSCAPMFKVAFCVPVHTYVSTLPQPYQ